MGRFLRILGIVAGMGATWVGFFMLIFYAFIFDISVAEYEHMGRSYGKRYVNEGLMQDRMVGVIVGAIFFVVGIIIVLASFRQTANDSKKWEES
jgi:cytochrome c biogenesis protein CcdA